MVSSVLEKCISFLGPREVNITSSILLPFNYRMYVTTVRIGNMQIRGKYGENKKLEKGEKTKNVYKLQLLNILLNEESIPCSFYWQLGSPLNLFPEIEVCF